MVTNISEAGCGLQLFTASLPSRYLTLKLYPQDGTASLLITMAEIRWGEKEWFAVGFVYVSQEDTAKLQRLCREHVTNGFLGHPAHPSGRQCLYDAEARALETIPMRKAWPHPA